MKTVLFVCVHNAGRSQMAEAFTREIALRRGMSVRALAGAIAGARIYESLRLSHEYAQGAPNELY